MSATPTATPAAQAPFSAEGWRQFWDAWKGQPRQLEGIEQLRQATAAIQAPGLDVSAWLAEAIALKLAVEERCRNRP